ncbi:hypothetical protein C8R45DRAFT_489332 [Mycena sanguinolenta]|nr:hypothetical protein C8R45DRAFT_489332 [Mycena sanguinolenta]
MFSPRTDPYQAVPLQSLLASSIPCCCSLPPCLITSLVCCSNCSHPYLPAAPKPASTHKRRRKRCRNTPEYLLAQNTFTYTGNPRRAQTNANGDRPAKRARTATSSADDGFAVREKQTSDTRYKCGHNTANFFAGAEFSVTGHLFNSHLNPYPNSYILQAERAVLAVLEA